MIRLTNVRLPLDYSAATVAEAAAKALGISVGDIVCAEITRRETVKKDIENICFKAALTVKLAEEKDELKTVRMSRSKNAEVFFPEKYTVKNASLKCRPVVVGFGPAGIFAALVLAMAGARPIVLERGADIDARIDDINAFQRTGCLNPQSNIQFGEGGAGAFSDGKLKTGFVDARKFFILSEFVFAGADESILYLEKAHIGSDRLHTAVKKLREKIISLGGEVRCGCKMTRLVRRNGEICSVGYEKDGKYNELDCENVIMAIGHSARDTFEYLYSDGIQAQQKSFAVGLRVEHPQGLIDRLQYGKFAGSKVLGAADYKLVSHLKNGRSVYTFCMCPGGYVVAAASERDRICTNGMSEFARDGANANAAMLVSISPSDFGSQHPLAGIEYQRGIESAGFRSGGGGYCAPVTRLEDFMLGRETTRFGDVTPTYTPGTAFARPEEYLPDYITDSLRAAFSEMSDWMPGYYFPDALLTGPETRTTSPVRLPRDESLEAVGIKGLYPCGEGAGYAGGIISAAVDGILCAEKILGK